MIPIMGFSNEQIGMPAPEPFGGSTKRPGDMDLSEEAKRRRIAGLLPATSLPRTPSGNRHSEVAAATPLAPIVPKYGSQSSLTVQEILAENERLRIENIKLRNQGTSEPTPGASPVLEAGVLVAATGDSASDASPRDASPRAANRLDPRTIGRPFNIRTWIGDRDQQRQRQARGCETEEAGMMMVELGEAEVQAVAVSEPTAASADAVRVADNHAEHYVQHGYTTWIPQHALASADSDRWPDEYIELRILLQESLIHLVTGDRDAAFVKFEQAFKLHLARHDRPHLAFSAALLPFCGALRDKLRGKAASEASPVADAPGASPVADAPGAAEGDSAAAASSEPAEKIDALGCAINCCTDLVRRLLASATYGDRPPKRRPDGMARVVYVRELASQIGLSLDLVRLTCASRVLERSRRRTTVLAQGGPNDALPIAGGPNDALPIADVEPAVGQVVPLTREHLESHTKQQDAAAGFAGQIEKVVDLLTRQAVVDRPERELHLKRAGHYLSALQMDMERLHDEAVEALQAAENNVVPGGPHILAVPIVERGALGSEDTDFTPARRLSQGKISAAEQITAPSAAEPPESAVAAAEATEAEAAAGDAAAGDVAAHEAVAAKAAAAEAAAAETPAAEALIHQPRTIAAGAKVLRLGLTPSPQPPERTFVLQVRPGSWADKALLQVGDEVLSVNGKQLEGMRPDDFNAEMQKRPITLSILPKAMLESDRVSSQPAPKRVLERVPSSTASTSAVTQSDDCRWVDPVATPTFGQFVDLHVTPLYIADVPFANLQTLFGHYCGLYLDSDDEDMTWKRMRLQRPSGKATGVAAARRANQPGRSPRGVRAVGAADKVVEPATASPKALQPEDPGAIADGRIPRTRLRAQLTCSVMEKRRHSMASIGDMAAPRAPRGRSSVASSSLGIASRDSGTLRRSLAGSFTDMLAPATPRVSDALLQQPTTPIARRTAHTPVTMKRPKTQASFMSPITGPGVSPAVALDWGLLDTPRQKRRL